MIKKLSLKMKQSNAIITNETKVIHINQEETRLGDCFDFLSKTITIFNLLKSIFSLKQ